MNSDNTYFNRTPEQLTNFLKVVGLACLGILTIFLLAKTVNEVKTYSTIGEIGANGVQNTISVSGTSDMDVQPDITVFTWTTDAEAKTSAEAQSKAAEINNKAIAFVKEKGIKEADIKTLSLNTYPKYETSYKNCPVTSEVMSISAMPSAAPAAYRPCATDSMIAGYTTSITIQVKVRDIDRDTTKTSELVGGLAAIGVKASNPVSTIDDMDAFKRVVRDEAIKEAREEAEKLAKALGVRLVRVTSYNDNSAYPYPVMDYAMSARGGAMNEAKVAPELPTGTNKVSATVNITYQIR